MNSSTQLKLDQIWARYEPSTSKVPPLSKIPEGKVRSFITERSMFERYLPFSHLWVVSIQSYHHFVSHRMVGELSNVHLFFRNPLLLQLYELFK